MIPRTLPTCQTNRWQDDMANLIRQPHELLRILELDPSLLETLQNSSHQFNLRVPRQFVEKMKKGDINDPLLRQVLPLKEELQVSELYSMDPLQEASSNPHPGLLHKYHGRVLLVVSASCAIHCRYCFRRHFPYQDNKPSRENWQSVLNYISEDKSINEVIFSGGDPLSASDKYLSRLTAQISQIPHIKRLRIHTRLPILLPNRIDDACLLWLKTPRLQTIMVLHSNHPNEIDHQTATMVSRLRQADITVLNQSVLLKGINDNVDILTSLSEKLFDAGILPYYLHLLDKVANVEHFDIPEAQARHLYQQLLARLPGFLVPKLVKELPQAVSKLPIL